MPAFEAFPGGSRDLALTLLRNADERLAAFGVAEGAHLRPTPQREQEQAEALLVALLGIGHALVDQADATRQHTQTLKELAAEGAL